MTNNAYLAAFGFTVGNVNAANATGRGNRAARRAGWRVIATGGPELVRQITQLMASI